MVPYWICCGSRENVEMNLYCLHSCFACPVIKSNVTRKHIYHGTEWDAFADSELCRLQYPLLGPISKMMLISCMVRYCRYNLTLSIYVVWLSVQIRTMMLLYLYCYCIRRFKLVSKRPNGPALYKAELTVLSICKMHSVSWRDFKLHVYPFRFVACKMHQLLVVVSSLMFKLLGVPKSGLWGKCWGIIFLWKLGMACSANRSSDVCAQSGLISGWSCRSNTNYHHAKFCCFFLE